MCRDHGLRTLPGVATEDAVGITRRSAPGSFECVVAVFAFAFLETDGAEESCFVEAESVPLGLDLGVEGGDAVVEPGEGHPSVFVVDHADQACQLVDRIDHRTAVHARVKVAAGTMNGDFDVHHPTKHGGDRRCLDVPHAGVRDHADVRGQSLTIRFKKRVEAGASRLLFAFENHLDSAGEFAPRLLEGTKGFQESHDLSLVVDRASCHDPGTMFAFDHDGVEGFVVPQLDGIGRLHVVMSVVENAWCVGVRPGMFGHDHRMPRSLDRLGFEAHVSQHLRREFGASCGVVVMRGIRADALQFQKVTKPFDASFEVSFDLFHHV